MAPPGQPRTSQDDDQNFVALLRSCAQGSRQQWTVYEMAVQNFLMDEGSEETRLRTF